MNDFFTPLNDEPIIDEQDLLGRRQLLEELKHAISQGKPPQVFGVHGDWGSGKTSFLRQLRYELTGEREVAPNENLGKREETRQNKEADKFAQSNPHITAIWFEAWRYQHEQTPIVALLHEIRSQLTWKGNFWAKMQTQGGKIAETTIRGALMSFEDITKKIGIQASKIQTAGETWEKEHLAVALPANQVRALLDEVLGQLLPPTGKEASDEKRRLVIFIDDLDRCEPETAFRLLEGIKIYLNLSRCVFVLGLNQREIERAIAKFIPSYKKESDSEELQIRAQEYMEKLCGHVLHLPLPDCEAQSKIVQHFLAKVAEEPRAKDVCDELVSVIGRASCLPANPRRIKSFCNTAARLLLRRLKTVPPNSVIPANEAAVACIVASFYQFHPKVYRLLASNPDFYEFIVRRATSNEKTAESKDAEGNKPTADELKIHAALDALELTSRPDEKASTPGGATRLSLHADPAYGNVLHCQGLIAANRFKIGPDEVRLYLEV